MISGEDAAEISRLFRETSADLHAYACTLPNVDRYMADDLVQDAFRAATAAWDNLAKRDNEGRRRWRSESFATRPSTSGARRGIRLLARIRRSCGRLGMQLWTACFRRRRWQSAGKQSRECPTRKKIAFLRWNEDWTSAEIASWLSISQDTVRGHLKVAREELMAQVGADVPFISDPEIDEGG